MGFLNNFLIFLRMIVVLLLLFKGMLSLFLLLVCNGF